MRPHDYPRLVNPRGMRGLHRALAYYGTEEMNTLNKDKLRELAKEAGLEFSGYSTNESIERFAALVLSAAQAEREPIGEVKDNPDDIGTYVDLSDQLAPGTKVYLAPPSSDQVWNDAAETTAAVCDGVNNHDNPMTASDCADAIRSLKRPLQAQEPTLICQTCGTDRAKEACKGDVLKCGMMGAAQSASPAAQSGAVDEPTTDDLPPLPAMAMTITDEPGKGHYYSANQMREYARLSRAQAAPDEVQAAEATLYRDLTGDAMAMGYDGIPAALEALRAQAAQQAQPVSDEQIDAAAHHLQEIIAQNGGSPSECAHDHIRDLCALLSQSAAPNEWKRAVDDELVTLQSTADSYATPKDAVRALIDWHVAVERDPKVSEQPAAQMAVPEGWKLVPIYPTAEMIHRGKHAPPYRAIDVYHAMLAAAPLENEMNKASSEASPQGGGK